jgi:PAS domain S-box-containing protein
MAAQAEAEARLEELENLYRSAPIGLALMDTDCRFVRINEFLAKRSARPDEDLIGRGFFELFPELEERTRPLCKEVLKTGEAVRGVELAYDKGDGRGPHYLLTHLYPIKGEGGAVSGIGLIIESTTERKRAEQKLARLAAIVYAASDAMFSFAPTGRIQNWNPAAQSLFQYTPEESVGKNVSMLFPDKNSDDFQRLLTAWQAGESLRLETEVRRKDGGLVSVSISIAPIKDGERTVAISTTIEDITERRHWEKRQFLMNRELSHRVKNSLAIIQAMARHTLRSSPNPGAFISAFEGRLRALATSHNLLTSSAWEGADLRELAREQLAFHAGAGGRLRLDGPALVLPPGLVTSLGLVLHELGANAAKYGALSAPGGSVALTWRVVEALPHRMLELEWTERGGPLVQKPERKGFGSVLIENSGKVEQHFDPEGLRCIVRMSLMSDEAEAKGFR